MRYLIQKKAAILANALIKAGSTRKDAFKAAWTKVKTEATKLLTFTKTNGTKSVRVVASKLSDFFTPNGNGKARPEGLHLFADMAKVAAGKKYIVISAYVGSYELV